MDIEETFTSIEKVFNIAGSIPLFGAFSGAIRVEVAKVQMVASVVFGLFGLIGQLFSSHMEKWGSITHAAIEHLVHGALNYFRGAVETLLALTIVGSLGLFLYQALSENGFEPIYKYSKM